MTKRRPWPWSLVDVLAFFALACGLSWLAWAPLTASALGWTDATYSPYLHLLGGLGPAAAGLIMAACGGRDSFARIIRRATKAPPAWVMGVAGPVALFVVAAAALMLLGQQVDLSAIGRSPEFPALGVGSYALANIVCTASGRRSAGADMRCLACSAAGRRSARRCTSRSAG